MKKLFISLVIINLFVFKVNADTYQSSSSIFLSYNVEPTYSIMIPKKINVSSNDTYFNYYVSGDIYADYTLRVLFDDSALLSNGNSTCEVYLTQEKTDFTQNELTNSYVQYTALISHTPLGSGNWTGELNVTISLIGGV